MSVIDSGVIEPADWSNVGGSGKSMSQLGDKWSKGFFGLPENLNPYVTDDTTDPRGKRGSVERANIANIFTPDPIFFLGGSPASIDLANPVRSVVISEGDVLVFPIINTIEPDAFDKPFPSEQDTRDGVNNLLDSVPVGFDLKVDGEILVSAVSENPDPDPETGPPQVLSNPYRIQSPDGGFNYIIPPKTWVRDPETGERVHPQIVEPAVQAGYWFAYDTGTPSFVQGQDHTLSFDASLFGTFALNVTYNILNEIEGTYRRDELSGTKFNDYIRGKTGKDSLSGLDGDDLILGGWGRDTIDGGSGDDELWGDFGKDTFIFKAGYGKDTIFDFARKEVVKIEGFTEYDSLKNVTLDSGVSAAQIDFGKHDILTLIGVDSKHLLFDFDDGTITLEHRFSI